MLIIIPMSIAVSAAVVYLHRGYMGDTVGPWGLYHMGGILLLLSLMYYWLGNAYLGKEKHGPTKTRSQPKDNKVDSRIVVWSPYETSIKLSDTQRSFRSSRCVFKKYIDHTPKLEFLFDPTIRHMPPRPNSTPKLTDFPLEKN